MRSGSWLGMARFGALAVLLAGLAGCSSSITRDWPEQPTTVARSDGGSTRDAAGRSAGGQNAGGVIGTPGNPAFYEVFGKRYYVMRTADGFSERGIASWYGPDFHGKPTSGGEIYNMHALTAAHKTLPIPTWVEVTNLNNGKQVIVRVNDRGPFVDDRIIDLSYRAAQDLDMIGHGTARVSVRALDYPSGRPGGSRLPEPVLADNQRSERSAGFSLISSANAAAVPSAAEALYVQVGAFSDRDNALGMVARLKRSGFDNTFVVAGGSDSLYRVRIGPLDDVREFDRVRSDLRSVGVADSRLVNDSR